nr:PH domain-containing protein [Agrococcus sp. ARC_14]
MPQAPPPGQPGQPGQPQPGQQWGPPQHGQPQWPAQAGPTHPGQPATQAPAPQDARAKAAGLIDGEWHRLHPASPLLRGGLSLIIFLGILFSIFRDRLIALFVPDEFEDGDWSQDAFGDFVVSQLVWVTLGVIGLVLLLIALFWIGWRVHRFRITGDAVEVQQGIFVKKHRRAPLSRIQGINIQKPWFARLLGACKFEIQQAGNDSNVDLNYLSSSVADALRYEILNRASGRSTADNERLAAERQAAAAASGVVDEFLRPDAEISHIAPDSLVRIPVGRIVLSSLLDGLIVWAVLSVIAVAVLVLALQQWWAVFALVPSAIAFLAAALRSLGAKLRYSIAATPDGIRLAYGLASTTTEILPPGRIFALQVKQPLLWRPFGWWQVSFTRAGKMSSDGTNQGQSQQMASYLLPVGDLRDVRTVIGLVLPELAHSPLVDQGLFGQAPDAFVVSPPRARAFRWFSVRRNGFHVHDAAFLLRHGRIWRSLQLVPGARVQSVAVQQGPIYGMARLARVQFHVPGTVLSPSIGAIDQQDAHTLFEHATRTIKIAIDRDASESWASSLSRNAVLATAPAVQDGLMPEPAPAPVGRGAVPQQQWQQPGVPPAQQQWQQPSAPQQQWQQPSAPQQQWQPPSAPQGQQQWQQPSAPQGQQQGQPAPQQWQQPSTPQGQPPQQQQWQRPQTPQQAMPPQAPPAPAQPPQSVAAPTHPQQPRNAGPSFGQSAPQPPHEQRPPQSPPSNGQQAPQQPDPRSVPPRDQE